MAAQEQPIELVDGALDGVGLLQDIHAILVFLDHPADALEMPLDVRQPLEYVRFRCLHELGPSDPPQGGTEVVYAARGHRTRGMASANTSRCTPSAGVHFQAGPAGG